MTALTFSSLLWDVLGFVLKTGTVVLGLGIIILLVAWLSQSKSSQPQLKLENWTQRFRHIRFGFFFFGLF